MFQYLITIEPLGLMYGSAGGFLSPENLVGRSRAKFPPEAATLSGLFFSANKINSFASQEDLRNNLHIAGPFWANTQNPSNFYVPIPWTRIISEDKTDEWVVKEGKWTRKQADLEVEPDYSWQRIDSWKSPIAQTQKTAASSPWEFVPLLHPKIKAEERHVEAEDGLFLENAVQIPEDICIVYLSTTEIPNGWYRFGGENHLVEINSIPLSEKDPIVSLLHQPIQRSFALITPGVWGSNRLSSRYPSHPDFPQPELMLTDKPLPYRFRAGGRMGRGRYAVSSGSVYVLSEALNQSWWDWSEDWFPEEGYSLKRVGCGLCLPLEIEGVI